MSILRTVIKAAYISSQTSTSKGNYGEMVVASVFHPRYFGSEEVYIVNNLHFKTSDNKTHQIDHVVIYKNGIFCIETKNIKGPIKGSVDAKMWSSPAIKFFNPIIQNKTHVMVLDDFLSHRYEINSVIVFVNNNKPKDISNQLVNIKDLKDYIKNYEVTKELSSRDMKNIFELLKPQSF